VIRDVPLPDVDTARERFARDLQDVRDALDDEWGWAPRGARWILPAVAVATGVFAGGALRKRLRRKRTRN
jgi:hypothetical protein